MLGRSTLMGAGAAPLVYRSNTTAFNANIANKPSGVVAGDLAVVITFAFGGTLTTLNGSAWSKNTLTTPAGDQTLFWKILNATDVDPANTWGLSSANIYSLSVAYSNGGQTITSASVRSTKTNTSDAQTTLVVPGFAASASGRVRSVIAGLLDADADVTPTVSGLFTSRVVDNTSATKAFADRLAGYSGEDVTWSGLNGASHNREVGWLLEAV